MTDKVDIYRCSILTEAETTNLIWGMPDWACWILIVFLLLFSGIFSASENAFTNCNKYHFRAEADKGKRYAKIITHLVDKFDNTLVAILVCLNAFATLVSFLSAMLWYQISVQNNWGDGVEAIVSTVVMGVLVYIVTDTIPKVLSKAIPDQVAILICYPIRFFEIILFPIIMIFKGILKLIQKMFHLKDDTLLSKDEILKSAGEAVNDEVLIEDEEEEEHEKLFEKDEQVLMDRVMSFDQRTVRQVYTPIDEMFSLNIDGLTADILNEEIQKTDYSRIPIYEETKDNIIGILIVKLYLEEYMKDSHLSIPSILEDVVYLQIDETLDDAFDILNRQKVHLGIVEEGEKVRGIITMEDILEELVSDISEKPVPPRKAFIRE